MRAADVTARTGISYRQLDYWSRQGLLPSQKPEGPGSGHARDFTEDDVAFIVQATTLADTLASMGLMANRRRFSGADRAQAMGELLASGMNRHKALAFLERWLPIEVPA